MRFSIWPSAAQPWDDVLATAQHAQRTGWDGVWIADHLMPGSGDTSRPMQECWTTLAALAVAVPRVRLGSLVCGNTYRNPALLVKQAVTVDVVSGGRVVLGIGAGWQENEHEAYGFTLPDVRTRLDMLDEACAVIRALTSGGRSDFTGVHYRLVDAPLSPPPVRGRLPLLVGGGGERRTMRIAARHADEWNCWGTPESLAHKCAVLDRHCHELGRDPATIARSGQALVVVSEDTAVLDAARARGEGRPRAIGTPDELVQIVGAYAEAGLDELVVPDFAFPAAGPARWEMMDCFGERVASTFRAR